MFFAKDQLTAYLTATIRGEISEQHIDWMVNMRSMIISCMSEFITVMLRVLGPGNTMEYIVEMNSRVRIVDAGCQTVVCIWG